MIVLKVALLFAFLSTETVFGSPKVHDSQENGAIIPCSGWLSKYEMWGFFPDCKGVGRRGGYSVEMSYNKLALRDKNYPAKKKPSVVRILFIGASEFVGPGVEEKFTALRVLESRLKKSGYSVEIINAAAEGSFTLFSAIRIEEYLNTYSPDITVFYFAGGHTVFFDYMRLGSVQYEGDRPIRLTSDAPFNYSFLPGFLRNFIDADNSRRRFTLWFTLADQFLRAKASMYINPPFGSSEREANLLMKKEKELLKYMAAQARLRNSSFYLLHRAGTALNNDYNFSWPSIKVLADRLQVFVREVHVSEEEVSKQLRELQIPLLEWQPPPELNARESHLPKDYHWSKSGSEIVGNSLYKIFTQIIDARKIEQKKRTSH